MLLRDAALGVKDVDTVVDPDDDEVSAASFCPGVFQAAKPMRRLTGQAPLGAVKFKMDGDTDE